MTVHIHRNYSIIISAVVPSVSDNTRDSITLCWTKEHADLFYRIYSVSDNGNLTKIADTNNDSFKISALEADTEYRFLVRAYVKDENGRIYWGEMGEELSCVTNSEKATGIINLLKSFIKRLRAILQTLFISG